MKVSIVRNVVIDGQWHTAKSTVEVDEDRLQELVELKIVKKSAAESARHAAAKEQADAEAKAAEKKAADAKAKADAEAKAKADANK